jgi:HlyD family secretion protein
MNAPKVAPRRRIVIVVMIVLLIAAIAAWQLWPNAAANHALMASGTIEARVVNIAPEISGRVVAVQVEEGQSVTAGKELVRLDDAGLKAQYAQAQAALQVAQANYDLLAAGSTAEQLRQAQAALDAAQAKLNSINAGPRAEQVAQAEANLNISKSRLAALERGGRPEQIAQAEANRAAVQSRLDQLRKGATNQDISLAKLAVDQAKNALWAAQANRDGVCAGRNASSPACHAAESQVAAAETAVEQAETRLAQLQAGATSDTLLQAEEAVRAAEAQLKLAKQPASAEDLSQARDAVRLAEAQLALVKQPVTSYDVDAAKAQVAAAQAQLDALKAGARVQQLAAAQAQVAVAQAQMQGIEVQLRKTVLAAPLDSIIMSRNIEPGEMAMAGANLFQLGQLASLELTVYLPEEKFALVTPGDQATVRVDAYPGRTFTATVLRIADHAEYTPRNVQTVEGRKDTVFAVRLSIANADLALKPGMPADVTFIRK